jgi:hypothetical protein
MALAPCACFAGLSGISSQILPSLYPAVALLSRSSPAREALRQHHTVAYRPVSSSVSHVARWVCSRWSTATSNGQHAAAAPWFEQSGWTHSLDSSRVLIRAFTALQAPPWHSGSTPRVCGICGASRHIKVRCCCLIRPYQHLQAR